MNKKVSDYLAEFLKAKNIKHVFGIVGAGNAHLFDAIYRLGFTEIICVHHEQAAVMAATTYYRTTGKVTVALLTTGAGSSNGVTGVLSAWMDSMPVMVISGNENSKYTLEDNSLRIWGVQGYDSTYMVSKITKLSERLTNPSDVLNLISKAYRISSSSRPGPVWIDIPMNIQSSLISQDLLSEITFEDIPSSDKKETSNFYNSASGVVEVIKALQVAKRPLLWLGNGIKFANAEHKVNELIETLQVPTLLSWQACDIIDSDHALCFGRAGVYGQRAANFILQNCDLLICIGTRLAIPQIGYDINEFAREAKIAMVDIDPKELSKFGTKINIPILSDARIFIEQILHNPIKFDQNKSWIVQCKEYKNRFPLVGPEHADMKDEFGTSFINSYRFMQKLEEYFTKDQIVVTDMGTALLSGHQILKFKPGQKMMTSTGLGEMGFGLPGAIGAAIGSGREVLCLNCDGGMMLNLQELQTIAHHQLPIKIIIFNNDGYLMIKHTQKALFESRYSGSDKKSGVTCPDFAKIAYAFNFPSFQIRTWTDMENVLPKIQKIKGPVICEVFTHPEQPFVPKLSVASKENGALISPPLEDLTPLLTFEVLEDAMIIEVHPKSKDLRSN